MGILKKRGLILALMRSKRIFFSLILLALLLMIVPLASAHLETPVNSRWAYTPPTINGVIGAGEWTDAMVRDFTLNMRRRTDGSSFQNLSARFYVKNDYTNIYAAVQIFGEDYDAVDGFWRFDGFALLFEDHHTGTLADGDNGMGCHMWSGSLWYANNDLFYNVSGSTVSFFGEGHSWHADVEEGGTNDGAMAWSHTNPVEEAIGNYTFEMMIPLVGTDGDAYDLAITTLPTTVGFKIAFFEGEDGTDGVYPDDPTIPINLNELENATTFGNLILHPRYTLTITTTAGGTTSPAPGAHTYGWGEVATVSAIPDPGYVFDHWELDGGYAGTSLSISVTMDTNHALKAFFKLAPPVVGGMAAPIVIPINGLNPLTSLIWLASAIILPMALTVALVKLKKKKQ